MINQSKIKKPITIIEYWFLCTKRNIQYPEWSHYIDEKSFDELETFIIDESNQSEEFLSLSYKKEYWKVIVANNYVWVIQTKSWTVIEILPKITKASDNEDIDKTRNIFLRMLKTLKDSPFKNLNDANLKNQKFPILEIFIQLFLYELSVLIKKWIKKNYISEIDNLRYIKWKLKIKENIITNIVDHSKFVCEFDDFSENIKENRLIKTCLLKLQSICANKKNQQDINLYLHLFSDVDVVKDVKTDLKIVDNINRLHTYYLPVLKWVKLFLWNESVVNFSWTTLALSLLFPMEKIFESYVANVLKDKLKNHRVDAQDSSFYLIENQRKFRLRPDIVIDNMTNDIIIADTKWKKIKPTDTNYWISQIDLYQLYAYAKKYDSKKLYLIYPENINFSETLPQFVYDNWITLRAIPYRLGTVKSLDYCELFDIDY